GGRRCLWLQLPPVRPDAKRVKLFQCLGHRRIVQLAALAGDDLDEEFAADLSRGVEQGAQFSLLFLLQRRLVVGMVEAQAFDAVPDRPFYKLGSDILGESEAQRSRYRQLDGPSEPGKGMTGELEHRLAAVLLVQQHAIAAAPVR